MRWFALTVWFVACTLFTAPQTSHEFRLASEAGQVGPFVIPASQKQATWALDPTNTTGCASDNNRTCASASCTSGDGPCVTYGSIATRWGTYSPRIQQVTTITVLGNMLSSDVVYLNPRVEGGTNYVNWNCALGTGQQAWSQALGTVTAKNRTTGQLLAAVVTPAPIALKQLLVNSGPGGAGVAWVTRDQAGTTWDFSQPTTGCTSPATSCAPVENNAWATGDTVTAYVPSNVYFAELLPNTTGSMSQATAKAAVYVTNCSIQTTTGAIDASALAINANVQLTNDIVQTTLGNGNTVGGLSAPAGSATEFYTGCGFVNVDFEGTPQSLPGATFCAGMVGRNTAGFPIFDTPTFRDDMVVNNNVTIKGSLAQVIVNGVTVDTTGLYVEFNYEQVGGFTSIAGPIWGPASVHIDANAVMQYPTGAGAAVANFLWTGPNFTLGGLGVTFANACSHTNATPDVVSCGIALTPAHLDAAQGVAGFGGYAYQPGGGLITNAGQ